MCKKYSKYKLIRLVLLLFVVAFTLSACTVNNIYMLDSLPGAMRKSYASPDFIGELKAEVSYHDGRFVNYITFKQ